MPQHSLCSGFVATITSPMRLSASISCECLSESCSELPFLPVHHLTAALQVTCRRTSPASLMNIVGRSSGRRPPRAFDSTTVGKRGFPVSGANIWNELHHHCQTASVLQTPVITGPTHLTSNIYFLRLTFLYVYCWVPRKNLLFRPRYDDDDDDDDVDSDSVDEFSHNDLIE